MLSLIGAAGTLELVLGALLMIGLFTRPVAFILSGEMAFAYFIGHMFRAAFFRCSTAATLGHPVLLRVPLSATAGGGP